MANVNARRFLPLLLALVQIAPAATAWAACTVERSVPGEPALFVRHFSPECTKAERAAQAVPAGGNFEAVKAGEGVSRPKRGGPRDSPLAPPPHARPGA